MTNLIGLHGHVSRDLSLSLKTAINPPLIHFLFVVLAAAPGSNHLVDSPTRERASDQIDKRSTWLWFLITHGKISLVF